MTEDLASEKHCDNIINMTDEDLGVFVLDDHCDEIVSAIKCAIVCCIVSVAVVTATLLGVYY
jgi:hypothetical protein